MKLSRSIKPISHVKAHMSEIIDNISKSHSKVIITHNGEAKAVLQDMESYEQFQESLALLKILAMSTKSKIEGKGQSIDTAFAQARKAARERLAL